MKQNKQIFKYEKFLIPARKVFYSVLYFYDRYILNETNRAFVLCYHSVSKDGWRFSISPSEFKRQINYLSKTYQFISADQLLNYFENKGGLSNPSVLICFDDGYKDLLLIKKYLFKKNIKPLLFVLSKNKSVDRKELRNNKKFLNCGDIKKLIELGWTVGSHGETHANFLDLNTYQRQSEIEMSKKVIERELNIQINYFAFPRGNYFLDDLQIIRKAGYKMAFSMEDRLLVQQTNPYVVPRIGVDRTHNFTEFKSLSSPSIIRVRNIFKRYIKYAE